jgi:hypothetical protein
MAVVGSDVPGRPPLDGAHENAEGSRKDWNPQTGPARLGRVQG